MTAGQHIGKILIKIREEESVITAKPNNLLIEATPKFFCHPEKTYVVCGNPIIGHFITYVV